MREDVVFRVEITDVVMERDPEFDVSEREMREGTEINVEDPLIFISVRLSIPPV